MIKNTSSGQAPSDFNEKDLLQTDILKALGLDSDSSPKESLTSQNKFSKFPANEPSETKDISSFFTGLNTINRPKSKSHKIGERSQLDFQNVRGPVNQPVFHVPSQQSPNYYKDTRLPPGELSNNPSYFHSDHLMQKKFSDDGNELFAPFSGDSNIMFRKSGLDSQLPVFSGFGTDQFGDDSNRYKDPPIRAPLEFSIFDKSINQKAASRNVQETIDFNTGLFYSNKKPSKTDSPDLIFPLGTLNKTGSPILTQGNNNAEDDIHEDLFRDINKFISGGAEKISLIDKSEKIEKSAEKPKPKPQPEPETTQTLNPPTMRMKSNSASSPSKSAKGKKVTAPSSDSTTDSVAQDSASSVGYSPHGKSSKNEFSSPGKSDYGERVEYRVKSSSVTSQQQPAIQINVIQPSKEASQTSERSSLSIQEDTNLSASGSNLSTPKSKANNTVTTSPGVSDSANKSNTQNSASPQKEKGGKKEEVPSDAPPNRKPSTSVVGATPAANGESTATKGQSRARRKTADNEEDRQYILKADKIECDGRTTLMIKNIPNKYDLNLILQAIDKNHKGEYDFFYLPIDFRNKCNVGYAFINFADTKAIRTFYLEFHDKKWEKFNSEKICEIRYARIQGLESLKQHFQYSSVMSQQDKKLKPYIPSEGTNPATGDEEKDNEKEKVVEDKIDKAE